MRSRLERDVLAGGECLIDEHRLLEQRAERRDRAGLALGKQPPQLVLPCQPKVVGAREHQQAVEVDAPIRGQHSMDRLIVGEEDDDFRPVVARVRPPLPQCVE